MPLSLPPPNPSLAYEARKAPGGAYHHNIFHQAEHLVCIFRTAIARRETPEVILFPYTVTPWAAALVATLLPRTRLVSTCCGREKVAAKWWVGERRVCPCWQKVCPERLPNAAFWPLDSDRSAHAEVRDGATRSAQRVQSTLHTEVAAHCTCSGA